MPEPFLDQAPNQPTVRGFLHRADDHPDAGLVLTHSAGGNCNSPLLVGLAEVLCKAGLTVLRYDLPFRQLRPHGPPLDSGESAAHELASLALDLAAENRDARIL